MSNRKIVIVSRFIALLILIFMVPDMLLFGKMMNINGHSELYVLLQSSLFQFSFLGNLAIRVIELVSAFSLTSFFRLIHIQDVMAFWIIYLCVLHTYKQNNFLYAFVTKILTFNLVIISILFLFLSYALFQIQFTWLFFFLKLGTSMIFIAYLVLYFKNIILITKLNNDTNSSIIGVEVRK